MQQMLTMTDPKKSDHHYEETMKSLRTNLQFAGRNVKTIVITSCFPNEGKSDISFQLAKEIGNIGKKVVLVDADIRRSNFITRYRIDKQVKGLSNYLCGSVEMEDICYQTNFDNLDIILAGSLAPNASELLEEGAFEDLINYLKEQYDYIIIDTPPVMSVADATIISKWCDGVVLVVEQGRVSYRIAQKAKKLILQSGCKILGAALNKVDTKKDRYYGKYGYYRYHGYYYYSRPQEK